MTDYDLFADSGLRAQYAPPSSSNSIAHFTDETRRRTTARISSISASQALRTSLPSTPYPASASALPTGLGRLDDALSRSATTTAAATLPGGIPGGIPRGSITEIYGPPGVGKTAFSLNIAAKTLAESENDHVVWIDTGSPIPTPRLKQILASKLASSSSSSSSSSNSSLEEKLTRFHHLRTPSLPHLLSLFTHPPTDFPPRGTTLLIIDSISAPFQSYFPNATELKSRLSSHPSNQPTQIGGGGTEQQQKQTTQWLLNRKWNVAADLAGKIVKLASPVSPPSTSTSTSTGTATAAKIAVLILNQTHTKIRAQPRPTLYPALSGGSAWENCIYSRIVLYRDLPLVALSAAAGSSAGGQEEDAKETGKVVYAEITKRAGKLVLNTSTNSDMNMKMNRSDATIFPFIIHDDGIRELPSPTPPTTTTTATTTTTTTLETTSPAIIRKRKLDHLDLDLNVDLDIDIDLEIEIADSDDSLAGSSAEEEQEQEETVFNTTTTNLEDAKNRQIE